MMVRSRSRFRAIRFFDIAVSTNLPNQSSSKKNLSTKVTVRIYIICIEYFPLFFVENILALIKSQLEFILILVERSFININYLLPCLCVRTLMIGTRIWLRYKRLFSIRIDRRVFRVEELESGVSF